jgi:hypothetical protein
LVAAPHILLKNPPAILARERLGIVALVVIPDSSFPPAATEPVIEIERFDSPLLLDRRLRTGEPEPTMVLIEEVSECFRDRMLPL